MAFTHLQMHGRPTDAMQAPGIVTQGHRARGRGRRGAREAAVVYAWMYACVLGRTQPLLEITWTFHGLKHCSTSYYIQRQNCGNSPSMQSTEQLHSLGGCHIGECRFGTRL